MTNFSPPNPDQIELILFGPGYGECVAIHLGEKRWMVVDSCLDNVSGNPAVLDYFNEIGISPQDDVKLIIISHWHDDHVRGLAEIVSSCSSASLYCSSVFTEKEFLECILNYRNILTRTTSSGVREFNQILGIVGKRPIKKASANKTVLRLPVSGSASSCVVTALSPSDKEYDFFLQRIGNLIPSARETKKRIPSLSPNNAAVAIWIEVGAVKILLGSDLEEKAEPGTGWSAIVHSSERPEGRAEIFKIPHHGSSTGHSDDVWSKMISNSPCAVLSPFYNAGEMLPTRGDVVRILNACPETYITTKNPVPKSKIKRSAAVERTIRETVRTIRAVEPPMGWVSLRNGGKANPNSWTVQLSGDGAHLDAFLKNK